MNPYSVSVFLVAILLCGTATAATGHRRYRIKTRAIRPSADVTLLAGSDNGLLVISTGTYNYTTLTQGPARGVAFNAGTSKIIWTQSDGIFRANVDGSELEQVLKLAHAPYAHVAVHETTGNIFFSDNQTNRIMVTDSVGEYTVELYGPRVVNRPEQLALNAHDGSIYWVSYGSIMKGNIYGDEPVTVVGRNDFVKAMALDAAHGRLYWFDEYTGYVRSSDLNGAGRSDLVQLNSSLSIHGMAVDESSLYFISNFGEGSDVFSLDKVTGGSVASVFRQTVQIESVVVVGSSSSGFDRTY